MIDLRPSNDKQATYDKLDGLLSEHARDAIGQPFAKETFVQEAFDADTFLGGVHARVGTDWVFIDLLAILPQARGKGVGTKLMRAVELFALQESKTGIWLDTFSFQAPGFYEKLGYERVGAIRDYPKGHSLIFLAKYLKESAC